MMQGSMLETQQLLLVGLVQAAFVGDHSFVLQVCRCLAGSIFFFSNSCSVALHNFSTNHHVLGKGVKPMRMTAHWYSKPKGM